ncbi:MAG TPA: hypothetical protein VLF66_00605 [Thermoanaerobaculia bacterium]|nr:hypothetical protein [Thermoanaerobaculia bacterium]
MKNPAPPSSFDEPNNRLAFREIFLVHTPPAGVASLRQAGQHMFTTALERRPDGVPEPPVADQTRALAEDLRYSARELARLESGVAGGGLTAEELSLSIKAGSWAREVFELARSIDGAAGSAGELR